MDKIEKQFPFLAAALVNAAPEVRVAYQLQQKPPHYELYDLQADPYEFRNPPRPWSKPRSSPTSSNASSPGASRRTTRS